MSSMRGQTALVDDTCTATPEPEPTAEATPAPTPTPSKAVPVPVPGVTPAPTKSVPATGVPTSTTTPTKAVPMPATGAPGAKQADMGPIAVGLAGLVAAPHLLKAVKNASGSSWSAPGGQRQPEGQVAAAARSTQAAPQQSASQA